MEENKSNFSKEETSKEESVEQSKEDIKKGAQGLFDSIKKFLSGLLDFRADTDRDATNGAYFRCWFVHCHQ